MAKVVWRKAPSVFTGGKAYFYTTRLGTGEASRQYWVSWDRTEKMWAVEMDAVRRPVLIGYVATPAQGKKMTEEYAKHRDKSK